MNDEPEQTNDTSRLFSLSYRGCSSRREMWVMTGILMGLQACCHRFLGEDGMPVLALFYILFVCPLFVRRARHMGATWYGVLVILLPLVLAPLAALLSVVYYSKVTVLYVALGFIALFLLLLLPLHVMGKAKQNPAT